MKGVHLHHPVPLNLSDHPFSETGGMGLGNNPGRNLMGALVGHKSLKEECILGDTDPEWK